MSSEQELELAAAAFAKLGELHASFMREIAALPNKTVNGGRFEARGGQIEAECLGVKFEVTNRPIARGGALSAIEYEFSIEFSGEKLSIWRLYLEPNGVLYTDASKANRFADYNNAYLVSKVIAVLANELLKSKVFAPNGMESR